MSVPSRVRAVATVALTTVVGILLAGPAAAAQRVVEESSAAGPEADQSQLAIAVVLVGVIGLVLFGVRRLSRGRGV